VVVVAPVAVAAAALGGTAPWVPQRDSRGWPSSEWGVNRRRDPTVGFLSRVAIQRPARHEATFGSFALVLVLVLGATATATATVVAVVVPVEALS